MQARTIVWLVATAACERIGGTPGGPADAGISPDALAPDALTPSAPSPLVNVLRVDGELPISGGIAVSWNGTTLRTYDAATGLERGRRTTPSGTVSVVGTGDLDGDGLADVAVFQTAPGASPCATGAQDRTLTVVSGANPSTVLYQATIPDACISINGAPPTAYVSLWEGALASGIRGSLVLAPQYYSEGWFIGAGASAFYTAETSAFDTYAAARPLLQPAAQGHTYMQFQQPLNGMTVSIDGGARYVAATSGRFLQFALAPLSSAQLLADSPFLARIDLVGRTYGLLQQDVEGNPHAILLIAGAAASDLYSDVVAASASNTVGGTDLWAAIERHVSILDTVSGGVVQKFYSYAHDAFGCCGDAYTYRNRVTYPSFARLPSAAGPSRLIYNVFDGSTWSIHISAPGDVASATVVASYYVWDVIPRGPDAGDVLASPVDAGRAVYVPDYIVPNTSTVGSWRQEAYFPQMTTSVFRWTRSSEQLQLARSFPGIPRLDLPFPRRATESASSGRLFPSLRASDGAGHAVLLVLTPTLGHGEQVIDW